MECTEVHFASLLSGGFTTMAVINPPERKLAKPVIQIFILGFYYIGSMQLLQSCF